MRDPVQGTETVLFIPVYFSLPAIYAEFMTSSLRLTRRPDKGGLGMAIILDECVRIACARRRAHGHDDRLFLRVERLQGRASAFVGSPEVINVSWMPHRWPSCTLVARPVEGVVVYMDTRVARYAAWHDITISAWHLGPITVPQVEPTAINELKDWERAHSVEDRLRASVLRAG